MIQSSSPPLPPAHLIPLEQISGTAPARLLYSAADADEINQILADSLSGSGMTNVSLPSLFIQGD